MRSSDPRPSVERTAHVSNMLAKQGLGRQMSARRQSRRRNRPLFFANRIFVAFDKCFALH